MMITYDLEFLSNNSYSDEKGRVVLTFHFRLVGKLFLFSFFFLKKKISVLFPEICFIRSATGLSIFHNDYGASVRLALCVVSKQH